MKRIILVLFILCGCTSFQNPIQDHFKNAKVIDHVEVDDDYQHFNRIYLYLLNDEYYLGYCEDDLICYTNLNLEGEYLEDSFHYVGNGAISFNIEDMTITYLYNEEIMYYMN